MAILVYCTFPDAKKAEEISAVLLKEKLIACANILQPMVSMYSWKDKVQKDNEVPVLFKTQKRRFKILAERVRALHPYENPCVISLKIEDGSPEFLKWIASETV